MYGYLLVFLFFNQKFYFSLSLRSDQTRLAMSIYYISDVLQKFIGFAPAENEDRGADVYKPLNDMDKVKRTKWLHGRF